MKGWILLSFEDEALAVFLQWLSLRVLVFKESNELSGRDLSLLFNTVVVEFSCGDVVNRLLVLSHGVDIGV